MRDVQTGMCTRGDKCPYAHNVFEYWLHPTRYRSQLCNDGPKCRRRVCFFAHTIDQLRVPPSKPFVAPDMLSNNSGAPSSLPALEAKPMDTGASTPEARSLYHARHAHAPYRMLCVCAPGVHPVEAPQAFLTVAHNGHAPSMVKGSIGQLHGHTPVGQSRIASVMCVHRACRWRRRSSKGWRWGLCPPG